jgi:hypothetical protein
MERDVGLSLRGAGGRQHRHVEHDATGACLARDRP